ncbi:MAG: acyl-CoA dehydrogenase family protein, partial [Alphaproteobacteria bacterium]
HSRLYDDDDTPTAGPNGGPMIRTMMFPKSSATMIDVWQVLGLRATGSDNYTVKDLFVPASHTYARDSDEERRDTGPIHRIPLLTFYGMVFSGLSLGVARSLLDDFIILAETKVSGGATAPMRENAVIQSEVAQCEARLRSSRAFLHQMIEEHWEVAVSGEPFPLPLRAQLRTSITWAMNQARDVANYAYHAAGTNAIFESNAFERRFRDMHTIAQQGQGHRSNFEAAGQAYLGLTPSGHRV